MNPNRSCRAESETLALLEKINLAQAMQLCTRLGLPADEVPRDAPAAQVNSKIWNLAKQRGDTTLADLEAILREQLEQSAPLYWMYVSCAEAERDDVLCRKFFTDLAARLEGRVPAGDLRYLDEGNAANPDVWSPWSLRALQEAQALICLYSAAFFKSRYCGRVWRAFLDRWEAHRHHSDLPNNALPPILPVRWGAPDEYPDILPTAARQVDLDHAAFGRVYAEKGLRFLCQQALAKREPYRQEYDAFLDRFAAHLVQAALPDFSPAQVPALERMRSVFYEWVQQQQGQAQAPDFANFIFLASPAAEIEGLRQAAGYGQEPKHWRPYYPDYPMTIENLSYEAAISARMNPNSFPLDQQLLHNIQNADKNRSITLLIVDPWTIRVTPYADYAAQYDGAALSWSTIVVCWNEADKDTQSFRSKLQHRLQQVFNNKFRARTSVRWRDQIGAAAHLREELKDVILSMRQQIADETPDPKVAEGLPYVRPQLVPSQPAAVVPTRSAASEELGAIARPRVDAPSGGPRG
jgi:FxsC-like protein